MFLRKYWLPLSVFIVTIAGVCLYLLQAQPPKDPIVVIKSVEVEKSTATQPRKTQTQNASATDVIEKKEGEPFHDTDAWHAETHEAPVDALAPVNELGSDAWVSMPTVLAYIPTGYIPFKTDEEVQNFLATASADEISQRVQDTYVIRHYKRYPDCQEHDAILADAKRQAQWYLGDLERREKNEILYAERERARAEFDEFEAQYFDEENLQIRWEFFNRMSDSEKEAFKAQLQALTERISDIGERRRSLNREAPVSPKPRHTH